MRELTVASNYIAIPENVDFKLRRELVYELGLFAAHNLNVLSDVHVTSECIEEGLELFYALDFDVINAYAAPWSRKATHAAIVRYIIEEDPTKLVLLPGTVEEMCAFIKYTKSQKLQANLLKNKLKAGKASGETISAAVNLCKKAELGKYASSAKVNLRQLMLALFEVLERYDRALERIEWLLNNPRVVELSSVYDTPIEILFDEDLANYFFVNLAAVRKGSKHTRANEIDAANIATVLKHTNLQKRVFEQKGDKYRGPFVRLLTNTACVLDASIEGYEEGAIVSIVKPLKDHINSVGHSLAVRSCYEACFAATLAKHCGYDKTLCRQRAHEQYERARILELAIGRLDRRERDLRQSRLIDTQQVKMVIRDYIPQYAKAFVADEWYQTIKDLLATDEIEEKTKSSLLVPERDRWIPLIELFSEKDKQRLLAIQRSDLTKVEFTYKRRPPKDLLARVGIKPRNVQLDRMGGPNRWVVENVFRTGGDEIFTLDQYDDCIYASWPCKLIELQAVELVNALFEVKDGLLGRRCNGGEFVATFDNGDYVFRLCKLPLKKKINRDEYKSLLSRQKVSGQRTQWEKQIPSELRCDTAICMVKFEISVSHRRSWSAICIRRSISS